jgi:type II/III secretion system protein
VEAGITLTISPTISAGNYLRLRVKIEVSNFGQPPAGLAGAPPDKTTRTVETPVTLADNHTAILGGLANDTDLDGVSKIPILGDLPLIGWLFRGSTNDERGRYLYVFLTPHIIDTDFALLDEISASRKRDVERLGGDVGSLTMDISTLGDSADVRVIGDEIAPVFEMPSAALPGGGEQGVLPKAGEPKPAPATAPPSPAPAPGFDDVFGYDKDKGPKDG